VGFGKNITQWVHSLPPPGVPLRHSNPPRPYKLPLRKAEHYFPGSRPTISSSSFIDAFLQGFPLINPVEDRKKVFESLFSASKCPPLVQNQNTSLSGSAPLQGVPAVSSRSASCLVARSPLEIKFFFVSLSCNPGGFYPKRRERLSPFLGLNLPSQYGKKNGKLLRKVPPLITITRGTRLLPQTTRRLLSRLEEEATFRPLFFPGSSFTSKVGDGCSSNCDGTFFLNGTAFFLLF